MSYVSTDIKKIIAEIIENKKEKGGVKNIYFVGCGDSLLSALTVQQLRAARTVFFLLHNRCLPQGDPNLHQMYNE